MFLHYEIDTLQIWTTSTPKEVFHFTVQCQFGEADLVISHVLPLFDPEKDPWEDL